MSAPDISDLWPVTLAQAKAHLRIVNTTDDTYLGGLVAAAASKIEQDTGVILRARSVIVAQDSFLDNGTCRVCLLNAPVNSITSVVYDAADGTSVTLASNQYRLRDIAGLPFVVPAYGVTWPATEAVPGAVRATINAGYASNAAIPANLERAALLLIGHWYENREAVNVGSVSQEIDLGYKSLIRPHRLRLVA